MHLPSVQNMTGCKLHTMKHFEDYNSLAGLTTEAGSHRSSI